jgi:hypothetical protein
MTNRPVISREWAKHLSLMLTVLFLSLLAYVPWHLIRVASSHSNSPPVNTPKATRPGAAGIEELYNRALKVPLTPERYATYVWAIRQTQRQDTYLAASCLIDKLLANLEARYRAKGGEKGVELMRMDLDHAICAVHPQGGEWVDKLLTWALWVIVAGVLFIPIAAVILFLHILATLNLRQSWQLVRFGTGEFVAAAVFWPFGLYFFDPKNTWLSRVYDLGLQVDDPDYPSVAWPHGQPQPRRVEWNLAWAWQSPLTVWRHVCQFLFGEGKWRRYSVRQKANALYLCVIAGVCLFSGESRVAYAEPKHSENPLTGVILFSYFSSAGGEPAQDAFLLFKHGYLAAYGYTYEAVSLEGAVDVGSFHIGKLRSTIGPFASIDTPGARLGTFGANGFAAAQVGKGAFSMPWQLKTSRTGGIGFSAPDTRWTWKVARDFRAGLGLALFANPHQLSSLLVGFQGEYHGDGGKWVLDVRAGPQLTGPAANTWQVRTGLTYNF